MARPKSRAAKRGTRSHPQEERIVSLNFLPQMQEIGGSFVPHDDFILLRKKYLQLFRRQRRESRRLRNKVLKLKTNMNIIFDLNQRLRREV